MYVSGMFDNKFEQSTSRHTKKENARHIKEIAFVMRVL